MIMGVPYLNPDSYLYLFGFIMKKFVSKNSKTPLLIKKSDNLFYYKWIHGWQVCSLGSSGIGDVYRNNGNEHWKLVSVKTYYEALYK